MTTISRLALISMTLAMAAACGSTGDQMGSWSRSYLAPVETVFGAVVEVLEDEGYLVEPDRASGRIVAEPATGARGGTSTLILRITLRGDRVVVDVQARPGVERDGMVPQATDTAVLELFHALDRRMQGTRG
jgi:hypothetical protein